MLNQSQTCSSLGKHRLLIEAPCARFQAPAMHPDQKAFGSCGACALFLFPKVCFPSFCNSQAAEVIFLRWFTTLQLQENIRLWSTSWEVYWNGLRRSVSQLYLLRVLAASPALSLSWWELHYYYKLCLEAMGTILLPEPCCNSRDTHYQMVPKLLGLDIVVAPVLCHFMWPSCPTYWCGLVILAEGCQERESSPFPERAHACAKGGKEMKSKTVLGGLKVLHGLCAVCLTRMYQGVQADSALFCCCVAVCHGTNSIIGEW